MVPTTIPAAAAGIESASPPIVVDVAYARLESVGGRSLRVGTLVDAIDADVIVVRGAPRGLVDVWRSAFSDLLAGSTPARIVVAHPSSWGRRRVGVLRAAMTTVVGSGTGAAVADRYEFRPRAELIAQTHLESNAQACVIVEAHSRRLDIHRLTVVDGRWSLGSTSVLDLDPPAADIAALVDDAVEAIIVDGENPDGIRSATTLFEDATPTGRVVAAERELIQRYGAVTMPHRFSPRRPPSADGHGTLGWAVGLGTALVVAVAVIAVVVAVRTGGTQRSEADNTAAPAIARTQIGRVTLDAPAGWRRTSDPAGPDGAYGFTSIASADDDRRLLVVENAVRADSTSATVATSLRNRLDQRGAEAVTEFSPKTSYAGREVISYREAPGSGAPIRWYVVVDDALQVSVGCQAGSRGQPVDDACVRAVSSLTIAPR